MLYVIGHFTYRAMRRSIPIQSNADRSAALGAKRFTEERLGGGNIPLQAQPEIDGVVIPVHRLPPTAQWSALKIRVVRSGHLRTPWDGAQPLHPVLVTRGAVNKEDQPLACDCA
jgi:hypothetical protein